MTMNMTISQEIHAEKCSPYINIQSTVYGCCFWSCSSNDVTKSIERKFTIQILCHACVFIVIMDLTNSKGRRIAKLQEGGRVGNLSS